MLMYRRKEVDGMKKAILAQKVLCSVLAIGLGGFVLPLAAQANSGLKDEPIDNITGVKKVYVGRNGVVNNVVIIDSDLIEQDYGVIGGYAEKEDAVNNRVTVSGGKYILAISGGHAVSGNVTDNIVNISGGTITGEIDGGYALDANKQVKDNHVNITGGYISSAIVTIPVPGVIEVPTGGIYGGRADGESSTVTGNSVIISGNTCVDNMYEQAIISGGRADGESSTVTGNSVIISGGTIRYSGISGGTTSREEGEVKGNNVTVSGGTLCNIDISGGRATGENSTIEGNSVTICGGTLCNIDIYGGRAMEESSIVEGNSVTICGGMVTGNVYGGYSDLDEGEVTGNSITLTAAADVSEANLYGGFIKNGNGTVEDNKLIINGWSGKVQSLNNFNDIEGGIEGGIEVKALTGGLDLAADKTTDFVFVENGIHNCNNLIKAENIQAGVALTVSGEIVDNNGNLAIKATSVRASDQTAITTESRAAAAAFVNQGAEAVSDSINSLQGAEAGISTFATVSGNNSKYDTGSYVDINGWNGIVGVAKTKDLNAGKFSYGAFFENGGGNYNTYNDFNGTSFRGDGNVVYNGGGLLMRYEQEDGVYTEASLRAGTAKNEVSNALEFVDNRYGFKTENAYYGAHIGIGKIIKLDNGKAWDIYGKYFHTHHEGDSVKIANDVFDFDSVDSDKLRIGARFSEQQGEKLTSYYGLAWEYEFSGDAGGTANHYAMYTPSLEGSTVIGEVGFRYTPGKASPWYFDANIRGYAGMQEGISGSVQAVYSF